MYSFATVKNKTLQLKDNLVSWKFFRLVSWMLKAVFEQLVTNKRNLFSGNDIWKEAITWNVNLRLVSEIINYRFLKAISFSLTLRLCDPLGAIIINAAKLILGSKETLRSQKDRSVSLLHWHFYLQCHRLSWKDLLLPYRNYDEHFRYTLCLQSKLHERNYIIHWYNFSKAGALSRWNYCFVLSHLQRSCSWIFPL